MQPPQRTWRLPGAADRAVSMAMRSVSDKSIFFEIAWSCQIPRTATHMVPRRLRRPLSSGPQVGARQRAARKSLWGGSSPFTRLQTGTRSRAFGLPGDPRLGDLRLRQAADLRHLRRQAGSRPGPCADPASPRLVRFVVWTPGAAQLCPQVVGGAHVGEQSRREPQSAGLRHFLDEPGTKPIAAA